MSRVIASTKRQTRCTRHKSQPEGDQSGSIDLLCDARIHSHEMKTRPTKTAQLITGKKTVTREYVHSLRGKLRGKGLLKALMAEKKRER